MCNVHFNFSLLHVFQSSCRCLTAGIDVKASVRDFLGVLSRNFTLGINK